MTLRHSPPLRVAVLAGGDSAQRQASLASGRRAAAALRSRGHRVRCYDPAVTAWHDVPWSFFDVCFLALHGGAGEDGRIQQRLQRQGIAYTGSGPPSARLAMSKSAAKERFAECGVPTLRYQLFHAADPPDEVAWRVAPLGYPLVVKPDSQGSSVGVCFVASIDALAAAVTSSARYDDYLLAEPWISGREFTAALLDRRALPLVEVAPAKDRFDHPATCEDRGTRPHRGSNLSDEQAAALQKTALAAAEALDTQGLVLVDLMLDERSQPWVLEINTTPNLSGQGLAPRIARQVGMSLADLCEWMLHDALLLEVSGDE